MTEANGRGVDISVSIVNWHTRDDLLECLGSFVPLEARQLPAGSSFAVNGLSCEVIVVDNASGDGSSRPPAQFLLCGFGAGAQPRIRAGAQQAIAVAAAATFCF